MSISCLDQQTSTEDQGSTKEPSGRNLAAFPNCHEDSLRKEADDGGNGGSIELVGVELEFQHELIGKQEEKDSQPDVVPRVGTLEEVSSDAGGRECEQSCENGVYESNPTFICHAYYYYLLIDLSPLGLRSKIIMKNSVNDIIRLFDSVLSLSHAALICQLQYF